MNAVMYKTTDADIAALAHYLAHREWFQPQRVNSSATPTIAARPGAGS